jgi:hypothetical protein
MNMKIDACNPEADPLFMLTRWLEAKVQDDEIVWLGKARPQVS